MINQRVEEEITKQINEEFSSAYLYLSMSAYFVSKNLSGLANWMRVQFQEEQFHALKMYDYLNERGGRPCLVAIETPKAEWKDILEVFEETYKHEQHITAKINHLVSVATEEKDYATVNFLQWYLSEQVEEEANVVGLLEQLKLIEGKGSGLFMLDREAKVRVFTPPVTTVK